MIVRKPVSPVFDCPFELAFETPLARGKLRSQVESLRVGKITVSGYQQLTATGYSN